MKVKENGGAAGADGMTVEQFEEGLKDNLYKLWNRMSSGSYFAGPVRAVEISKKGGTRVLGKIFTSFLPAVSKEALKRISAQVRAWRLHLRTGHTFAELAREINPVVRGWMQYYGAFYQTALYSVLSDMAGTSGLGLQRSQDTHHWRKPGM